jgi:hypothetical protein
MIVSRMSTSSTRRRSNSAAIFTSTSRMPLLALSYLPCAEEVREVEDAD